MSGPAEAVTAAGRILAITRAERDEAYTQGGSGAVAEYVHRNGTPQQQENVARLYEHLRQQSSKDSAA